MTCGGQSKHVPKKNACNHNDAPGAKNDKKRSLSGTGEVSPTQLAKGLQRVADGLADARLDNPAVGAVFFGFVTGSTLVLWQEEKRSHLYNLAPQTTPPP
jgi:hypothetical protein